ncbi:MAG: UDP-2,3-diacylglucosamine diphosphatase [bacterium]
MNEKALIISDCHISTDDQTGESDLIKLITHQDFSLLILLGDTFDFYFDFKNYIPENYMPILNILKKISSERKVVVFKGNHDMWFGDSFKKQTNAQIEDGTVEMKICGGKYLFNHGDDFCDKSLLRIIADAFLKNSSTVLLFSLIPPRTAYALGRVVSKATGGGEYKNKTKQMTVNIKKRLDLKSIDAVIVGHSHSSQRTERGKIIFLGDFKRMKEFAVIDEKGVRVEHI